MEYQTRATWSNVTGNQRIEPLRIYRPSTVTAGGRRYWRAPVVSREQLGGVAGGVRR